MSTKAVIGLGVALFAIGTVGIAYGAIRHNGTFIVLGTSLSAGGLFSGLVGGGLYLVDREEVFLGQIPEDPEGIGAATTTDTVQQDGSDPEPL